MKKIVYIGLLMFFIQSFILIGILVRNVKIPKYYQGLDHGIYSGIGFFLTLIIFLICIILVIVEYIKKIDYKMIMQFLVFGNCFLEFYINLVYQFRFFSKPEWYDISGKIIISLYFLFELGLTFYVTNRLYK